MGYHYRARYEFILFFEKGKRKLNNLGISDVLEAPRIHRGYPTEKPVSIAEVLVTQSTQAGEIVIDPFCGSGSVGVAAQKHDRRFLGNDLSKTAVVHTLERLGEQKSEAPSEARPKARLPRTVVSDQPQLSMDFV